MNTNDDNNIINEPNVEQFEDEYTNADINVEQQSIKESRILKYSEDLEEILIIPPDGGWGWIVVIGSFIIFFITEGIIYTFGIFFKEIGNDLQCSRSHVSLIGALKTSCICFSGPFSAALINSHGYRFVGITGAFLAGISTAISALVNDITLLIITYSVFGGIGFGMLYVSAVIVIGFYFERWRSLATGISLCGAGIGCTIIPSVLTLILQNFGWKFAFLMKGIMLFICGICALTFKPLKPKIEDDNSVSRLSLDKNVSTFTDDESNASKVKFNFFDRYHNNSFPTMIDVKSSTFTILQPQKMDRCESSVTVFQSIQSKRGVRISKMLSPVKESDSENSRPTRILNFNKVRTCFDGCYKKYEKHTRKRGLLENISARPLYRDDIFYHGSMNLIPEYRRSMQSKTISTKSKLTNYSMSVSRIVPQLSINNEEPSKICSKHIKVVLATMLDIRLMKLPYFPMLILNNFFTSFGFFVPYMFIKDRAIDNGISEEECFWLISTIGVTNTIGRIFCGAITLVPQICPVKITAIFLTIGGVSTILSGLSFNVWIQFLYAGVYGFSIASISTLRTIIIVQVLGLNKLTNAMGMIMLAQGFASLAGIWTAGLLRDAFGVYKWTFYSAGLSIVISGLILFCVKKISNNGHYEINEITENDHT